MKFNIGDEVRVIDYPSDIKSHKKPDEIVTNEIGKIGIISRVYSNHPIYGQYYGFKDMVYAYDAAALKLYSIELFDIDI